MAKASMKVLRKDRRLTMMYDWEVTYVDNMGILCTKVFENSSLAEIASGKLDLPGGDQYKILKIERRPVRRK